MAVSESKVPGRDTMNEQRLISFLDCIREFDWFGHAGEPFENGRVVAGLQSGWDGEGKRMLELWGRESHALEAQALESLTDQEIHRIFTAVSDSIHEPLYKGLCSYLDRRYSKADEIESRQMSFDDRVFPDVLDSVKRDVCWAGVEHVLQVHGFFGELLVLYRRGRWACSWDGEYPEGQPVIL